MTQTGPRPVHHQTAAAAFQAEYGRAPAGVWSAPGRVNLVGEHTDYHDGLALPFAIPHRVYVAAAARSDGMLRLARCTAAGRVVEDVVTLRIDRLGPGAPSGWAAYPAGTAWALRQHGLPLPGADLMIAGAVPVGAGLASSHALLCATVLALRGLCGDAVESQADRLELAMLVQRVENEFVGAPTGLLDQLAVLLCTDGNTVLLDTRALTAEQLPMDLPAAGLTVLVVDTGVRHAHARSGYADRRRRSVRAAELLGVRALRDIDLAELPAALDALPGDLAALARHVVTENDRVRRTAALLRLGRPAAIGELLTASHRSLRDDYQVSCLELDLAVNAALTSGALGARMTGGGFGGCAIALIRADDQQTVAATVRAAFAEQGRA